MAICQGDLRANCNLGVYKGGLYELHGGNVGWENRVLALPCFSAFLRRRFLAEHGDDSRFG